MHHGITLRSLLRNPRFIVPAALLVAAVVAGTTWFGMRVARQNRARNELVPEIARLAAQEEYWKAFLIARKAEAVLGNDPLLQKTLQDATSSRVWAFKLRGMDKGIHRCGADDEARRRRGFRPAHLRRRELLGAPGNRRG